VSIAPDYLEPVIGWRLWLAIEAGDGVRLRSIFHETEWVPGEAVRAECLATRRPWSLRPRSNHAAPQAGCRCGIYAGEPELLIEYLHSERSRCVFGRVQLWGTVIACEHGWRGECAYPSHLYVPAAAAAAGARKPAADEVAAALAVYGVPVEATGDLSPDEIVAAA
jgi:hypothetical protein